MIIFSIWVFFLSIQITIVMQIRRTFKLLQVKREFLIIISKKYLVKANTKHKNNVLAT